MRKTQKTASYSAFNNRPYKVMSPEDMQDDLMAFTFNPKFIPDYKNFVLDMATYHNELINLFSTLKYAKIKVYHEISCLGKWHLHGFIKITDKMRFTLFDLHYLKDKGVFEIDTIGNMEEWKLYIHKQRDLMLELLQDYKIPYDIDNIDGKLLLKKIDPVLKMAKCKEVDLTNDEYNDD